MLYNLTKNYYLNLYWLIKISYPANVFHMVYYILKCYLYIFSLELNLFIYFFNSVQLLSCVSLFATSWTEACQVSLSFTSSWSLDIFSLELNLFFTCLFHSFQMLYDCLYFACVLLSCFTSQQFPPRTVCFYHPLYLNFLPKYHFSIITKLCLCS